LDLIRERIPAGKWMFANAGRNFAAGSPFPQYLNGYLLENFLGSWGAGLDEGLDSAQRALETTEVPHMVVFAVDTDDTGKVDWKRFRIGLAASLLMDNTYFGFDFGSRDRGGVADWWFPEYYEIDLGRPLKSYYVNEGVFRRDYEKGVVILAAARETHVLFDSLHYDPVSGETGLEFIVPEDDARIFLVREYLDNP